MNNSRNKLLIIIKEKYFTKELKWNKNFKIYTLKYFFKYINVMIWLIKI